MRKAIYEDDDMPSITSAFVDPEVEAFAGQRISIDDIKEFVGKECLEPWKSIVKDDTVTLRTEL